MKFFFAGLLVDGIVISIFFIPAYIFTFFKYPFFKILQNFYLYIVTFLFLIFSIIDIFFFQAFYSRFDINILKHVSDFSALTGTFLTVYHQYSSYGILIVPLLLIISWLVISPRYFFYPLTKLLKLHVLLNSKNNYKMACFHIFILFIMSLSFIALAFHTKLSKHLYNSFSNIFYLTVASNSLHNNLLSFLSTANEIKSDDIDEGVFFKHKFQDIIGENEDKFLKDHLIFSSRRFKNPSKKLQTKPHIVLLNIDSLSQKFLDPSHSIRYLPYLDKMAQEGLSFTNFHFHWQCSINAFTSLLLGFPMIDANNWYHQSKSPQKISIIEILKSMDYKSSVFIGSNIYNLGSRFLKYGGDQAFGPKDFDINFSGYIKVDDQQLLERAFLEIKKIYKSNPLFVKIMLNSLHFGDVINSSSNTIFQEFSFDKFCTISSQKQAYHKRIQKGLCYTNWLVENFVKKLSTLLGDNLIVILTGEHRSWNKISYTENSLEHMQVPLIILDRRDLTRKGVSLKVSSHHDVPTTILHMIGYEGYHSFLGKNLMQSDEKGISFFSDAHYYYYRTGRYLVTYHLQSKNIETFEMTDHQVKVPLDNPLIKSKLKGEFKTYFVGVKKWLTIQQNHHSLAGIKDH